MRNRVDINLPRVVQAQRPVEIVNEKNATVVVVQSLKNDMSMERAMKHVPDYDGSNMSVKEFIQDIVYAASKINATCEADLISEILCKLKGSARDCAKGKNFAGIGELIDTLKERFATGQPYEAYFVQIINLKMYREESVNDLYDRLTSYSSGCKAALYPTYNQAEIAIIMRPFNQTALRAFIDALPDDISGSVDRHDPVDLTTALTYIRILGRPLLREERASVSFFYNALVTQSKPVDPIPFIDPESNKEKIKLKKEVKPVPRILRIKARTKQIVSIPVINEDLRPIPEWIYVRLTRAQRSRKAYARVGSDVTNVVLPTAKSSCSLVFSIGLVWLVLIFCDC
ncbi:uncharacterized protein LOC122500787 [Leptopilina heterotoma]|uniref:uncharacterized protein LOC122500787 n=1 Tax=Leptopilina heterotoma TaxID=63436 RepID=UPI001CA8D5C5|nr:uncharacterized protein LOC122500787 [Leptopilina heterotoma]